MEKETFHSRNSLRATRETPRRKSRRRPRRLSEDDLWISANCLYNFSYFFSWNTSSLVDTWKQSSRNKSKSLSTHYSSLFLHHVSARWSVSLSSSSSHRKALALVEILRQAKRDFSLHGKWMCLSSSANKFPLLFLVFLFFGRLFGPDSA